jgi:hypothetical protein
VPPEATKAHDGGNDRIRKDAAVKRRIQNLVAAVRIKGCLSDDEESSLCPVM